MSKKQKPAYSEIEKVRKGFLDSKRSLELVDYGSGSMIGRKSKHIKTIAAHGISAKKFNRLLDQIADYIEAEEVIELGTSLGINTLYLSCEPTRRVITLEGDPSLSAIAQAVFDGQSRGNVKLVEGNIDQSLSKVLTDSSSIDLVFFDANHTYEATCNYFEIMLSHKHDGTCFVFDDIHRNSGMEQAWNKIKSHYEVTLTIDLFQFGIVFFNPEIRKQNYILNF